MSRSIAVLSVILLLCIKSTLCGTLVKHDTDDLEGSLCHRQDDMRGICRKTCEVDNWSSYRWNICNQGQLPLLYCCVDPAAEMYPTINEVCLNRTEAEEIDVKRRNKEMKIRMKLIEMKRQEQFNETKMSCNVSALDFKEEERADFLELCAEVSLPAYSEVAKNVEIHYIKDPSIVAVGFYDGDDSIKWICTGHFIHPLYVLTSAYCIKEEKNEPNVVRHGRPFLYDIDFYRTSYANATTYVIKTIYIHEMYDEETLHADIALLRVQRNPTKEGRSTEFYFKPVPACLWTKDEIPTENVTWSGYSVKLLEGGVTATSPSNCADDLGIDSLDETRVCYVCDNQDESGIAASLNYREGLPTDVPYLVGMGSCRLQCKKNEPALFTLVYPYLSWIESIISGKK